MSHNITTESESCVSDATELTIRRYGSNQGGSGELTVRRFPTGIDDCVSRDLRKVESVSLSIEGHFVSVTGDDLVALRAFLNGEADLPSELGESFCTKTEDGWWVFVDGLGWMLARADLDERIANTKSSGLGLRYPQFDDWTGVDFHYTVVDDGVYDWKPGDLVVNNDLTYRRSSRTVGRPWVISQNGLEVAQGCTDDHMNYLLRRDDRSDFVIIRRSGKLEVTA
jgi:hypothetical protein